MRSPWSGGARHLGGSATAQMDGGTADTGGNWMLGRYWDLFPLRGEAGGGCRRGWDDGDGKGSAMRWRSVTEWGVGGRDWVGGQERERTVLDDKLELRITGIEFA